MTWIWHPSYAPVRKAERLKKLVREIGLLDSWRASGPFSGRRDVPVRLEYRPGLTLNGPSASGILIDIKGGSEFHWFAVRGVKVCVGPGFLALVQLRAAGETFCRHELFQSREPMLVIMRAIVGFAALGGHFEFVRERCRPFLPGKVAMLGEFHRERESLR